MNRQRRLAPAPGRLRGDMAYAIVLTALTLIPLFGFAGFAVDVGSWYARASAIQKAADAAALAGVIWQPDFTTAEAVAQATAARNGFVNGVDGITVTVVDSGNNTLQVMIQDSEVELFFSSLFLDDVNISRAAVSEYVLAVPLGSPRNYFGTNDLVSGSGKENFSAAINGSCTPREQGDHRSTHFMNNWGLPGYYDDMLCPTAGGGPGPDSGGQSGNTTWNANTYWEGLYSFTYYVSLPAALADPVDLYIRDPNWDVSGPLDSGDSSGSISTHFRLRAPDSTPFDDTDNPIYTGCSSGRGSGDGHHEYSSGTTTGTTSLFSGDGGTWDLFCRIPTGATGRYILEVGTADFEFKSRGSNNYALLARPISGPLTCDTRVSATCPAVVAKEWMSIYAALPGSTADFFLAEIGDEHEGKLMRITLFDPGEGSDSLQILDPDGIPVSFSWSTTDGLFSGSGTSLDVSQTSSSWRPAGNASSYQFSDRFVEIDINLPNDFTTAYATSDRWWKVKYDTGSAPTDRTSWAVEILGDPVRLLE
ncbi:MAG: pilus assembly protein TadG-related protein [Acidimicrobiales bacterium]